MPRWDAWLAGLADVLGPPLLTVPPNIGSHKPRDLVGLLKLAWRHRGAPEKPASWPVLSARLVPGCEVIAEDCRVPGGRLPCDGGLAC